MAVKTYGDKPLVFRLEKDGEEYMIGSEVGNYFQLFRGALYKRYPGMYRRTLTNEERKKLAEMGHSHHVTASSISLLRASEVEDILAGNEEKYRGSFVSGFAANKHQSSGASAALAAALAAGGSAAGGAAAGLSTPARAAKTGAKGTPFVPVIANSSHLDAVPQPTPINRNRVVHKKVIQNTFAVKFSECN